MVGAQERFGPIAKPVQIPIESLPHVMIWSARLANDPAIAWFRPPVGSVVADFLKQAAVPTPE
jgi:hypothetical protein